MGRVTSVILCMVAIGCMQITWLAGTYKTDLTALFRSIVCFRFVLVLPANLLHVIWLFTEQISYGSVCQKQLYLSTILVNK